MARRETKQLTFDGITVPVLPFVRTSDGHIIEWNRDRIVRQIVEETKSVETFYGYEGADESTAQDIALEVENRIKNMGLKSLSGPLIREIVNITLLERGMIQDRNVSTRVGLRFLMRTRLMLGGDLKHTTTQTSRKMPRLRIRRKQTRSQRNNTCSSSRPTLPIITCPARCISMISSISVHAFCQDWDLRYFFYYGLMPDGNGTKASVAGPAKRPEVAILHAVKALGSAQTNFAGGQGYYNFLTFLAPYMEGMEYNEIKQNMQMFVYEMTQMMVARGGQAVFSSIQLSTGSTDSLAGQAMHF